MQDEDAGRGWSCSDIHTSVRADPYTAPITRPVGRSERRGESRDEPVWDPIETQSPVEVVTQWSAGQENFRKSNGRGEGICAVPAIHVRVRAKSIVQQIAAQLPVGQTASDARSTGLAAGTAEPVGRVRRRGRHAGKLRRCTKAGSVHARLPARGPPRWQVSEPGLTKPRSWRGFASVGSGASHCFCPPARRCFEEADGLAPVPESRQHYGAILLFAP